jgi:hypothetical protein
MFLILHKHKGGSTMKKKNPDRGAINFRAWPFRGILDQVSKETGLTVAAISLAYRAGTNECIINLIDTLVEARKTYYDHVKSRIAA